MARLRCRLTRAGPPQVLYCGACTNPPEYCAWTGAKVGVVDDACKAWLLANAPEMATKFGYAGGEAAAGGEGEGEGAKAAGGGGGKKKKEGVKEVLVSSKQRQKKKFVCTVRGLETFGVKLPDACKVFKKKFSTGASVTETPDQKEEIEIQVPPPPQESLARVFLSSCSEIYIIWRAQPAGISAITCTQVWMQSTIFDTYRALKDDVLPLFDISTNVYRKHKKSASVHTLSQ